jgi:hypothetical protein
VKHIRRKQTHGEIKRRTISQDLIMEFITTMEYVFGNTSQWIRLYITSAKIDINAWKYLNYGDALEIHYLDPHSDYTSGFMARNCEKLSINWSNYVTITYGAILGSMLQNSCHTVVPPTINVAPALKNAPGS